MYNLKNISSDHEIAWSAITEEELKLGMYCAKRIKHQLERQAALLPVEKFTTNLIELESVIKTYQTALVTLKN